MLIAFIIAAEIGFWALLGAGLVTRYVLHRRRLSEVLLMSVPVVDLMLLVATVVDLRRGGDPGFTHGLAAAYLGVSVAFGPSMVRWADARVAHRFAGAPAPSRPPRSGPERVRHEWREFRRALLAWAIATGLLLAGIAIIGDAEQAEPLLAWIGRLALVVAIWSLWPITHALRGRFVAG